MSTQKIPNSQKQIIQSNVGDYRGNLWSTFNIDLDSDPGVIKVAPRLFRVVDATVFGTTDVMQALQIHDGDYYVITNDAVASCSVINDPTNVANWSNIATLGSEDLGLESDATSFGGLLLISLGTNIMSWNASTDTKDNDWWTAVAGGSALTANKPHTLEVLRTGNDTVFVTDSNLVKYYNSASGATTITLDTLMTANCLTPGVDRMWVGTYTEVENNAYIYEVQVGNTVATSAYEIDGRVSLSMFTYRNTPFVITDRGFIQAYNGAGFQTVAQFPWADDSKVMEGCRPGVVQDSPTALAIHPKGVKVKGKYAYIYVNADDEYVTSDVLLSKRGASGVWVLDLETYSLTHKYALNDSDSDAGALYGSHKVDRSGPLLITNTPQTRIMVAGSINNTEGVWMEGDAVNQAYFTTVRHEVESIADAFESFTVKHDTLDTNESIIVKYKDKVIPNFPLEVQDVAWLSANQFNTTATLTNVEVGHEVEVVYGDNSGNCATITGITGDTTKTITLDADIGAAGDTSDVYFDNWIKVDAEEQDAGEYQKVGKVDGNSTFRQYKVIMKGDVTVRETLSKSNSKQEQ